MPLLPFTDGLIETHRADAECAALIDRHYSRQSKGSLQFVPPGECLVLRNAEATILFVWLRNTIERYDKQVGINCTVFRNESSRLASEIILEAEAAAVKRWGPIRAFTYVDPGKIKSSNPGYCFKKAGWKQVGGLTRKGKMLFEKELTCAKW